LNTRSAPGCVKLNDIRSDSQAAAEALVLLERYHHSLPPQKVIVVYPRSGDERVTLEMTQLPGVEHVIYPYDAPNHIRGIRHIMGTPQGSQVLGNLLKG